MSAQEFDINTEIADLQDKGMQTGQELTKEELEKQNEINQKIEALSDQACLNDDINSQDLIYLQNQSVQATNEPADKMSLKEKERADRQKLAEQFQDSDYSYSNSDSAQNEDVAPPSGPLQQITRSQILREMREEGQSVTEETDDFGNNSVNHESSSSIRNYSHVSNNGVRCDGTLTNSVVNDSGSQSSNHNLVPTNYEPDNQPNSVTPDEGNHSYQLEQIHRSQILREMRAEGQDIDPSSSQFSFDSALISDNASPNDCNSTHLCNDVPSMKNSCLCNTDENSYQLQQIPRHQIMTEMKDAGEISDFESTEQIDTKKQLRAIKRESKENLHELKREAKLERKESKKEYKKAKRNAKKLKRELSSQQY